MGMFDYVMVPCFTVFRRPSSGDVLALYVDRFGFLRWIWTSTALDWLAFEAHFVAAAVPIVRLAMDEERHAA